MSGSPNQRKCQIQEKARVNLPWSRNLKLSIIRTKSKSIDSTIKEEIDAKKNSLSQSSKFSSKLKARDAFAKTNEIKRRKSPGSSMQIDECLENFKMN